MSTTDDAGTYNITVQSRDLCYLQKTHSQLDVSDVLSAEFAFV